MLKSCRESLDQMGGGVFVWTKMFVVPISLIRSRQIRAKLCPLEHFEILDGHPEKMVLDSSHL